MQILINNEKLDFTLENERNLFEVIESIENWLNENHVVISLIDVDGIEVNPNMKDKLRDFEIDKISDVKIETSTQSDMAIMSLKDAYLYLDKFIDEFKKEKDGFLANKDDKIEGLLWLSDLIFGCCNVLHVNVSSIFSDESSLEELLAFLALSSEQLEKKKHDDVFFYDYFSSGVKEKLEKLQSVIPIIIQQAIFQTQENKTKVNNENIIHVITSLKNNVYTMSPVLTKISENFQSGNDIEALIGIKKVTGVLDNLIISLKRIEDILGLDYNKLDVNGQPIEEINKKLLDLLTEIFEAFKNQDTVLLSDLIEYELIEYFETYKDVLETLSIITNQKKMVN